MNIANLTKEHRYELVCVILALILLLITSWAASSAIPASGFQLKASLAACDARRRFDIDPGEDRKRAGEMPPLWSIVVCAKSIYINDLRRIPSPE